MNKKLVDGAIWLSPKMLNYLVDLKKNTNPKSRKNIHIVLADDTYFIFGKEIKL